MLESPIIFNGLTMNSTTDRDAGTGWYQVLSVDGIWDQDVRFESINLPGRSGARSADSFYSGKTVVLAGQVMAPNIWTLRAMQLAMQQAFDDMLPYKLYFSFFTELGAKTDLYLTCRKNQKIDMPESVTTMGGAYEHRRNFTIQLFADDPNIYVQDTDAGFILF